MNVKGWLWGANTELSMELALKKLYSFACPLPVRIEEAVVPDYYT